MTSDTGKFKKIGTALKTKLEGLTYPNSDNKVFKKVLLGFDEEKIKVQGNGVVAVTYVTGANEYTETFGRHNVPHYINSIVAYVIKGTSKAKYDKAVTIMDLLSETLETDSSFYRLEIDGKRTVRDTNIVDLDLRLDSVATKLDTIVIFQLKHHVFK